METKDEKLQKKRSRSGIFIMEKTLRFITMLCGHLVPQ